MLVIFVAACFVVIAIAMIAPQLALAQFSVRPVQPKSDYFRFKAKYTVIATGEVVQFDLVRPCFAVSGRDIAGDSVGLPPNKPGGYFNAVNKFPKVTSDHHAIVVRIPRACDGETTANGRVQADLLPYVTWFDDADDLSYGWQFTSEDAYKSPLAPLRFDGASIETADKSDFLAWQRQAARGFRASKLVLSPYGFSFEQLYSDAIASSCWGVKRLTLPDEIRVLARAAWPDGHPRFWMVPLNKEARTPAQSALHMSIWSKENQRHRFNDGNTRDVLIYGLDVADGLQSVPTRQDGAIGRPRARPPNFFPKVAAPYGFPFLTQERLAAPILYIDVDVRPEYSGFFTCYIEGSAGFSKRVDAMVTDINNRVIQWRISGQPVVGQPPLRPRAPNSPGTFFESDEFAYEYAENPM